MWLSGPFRRDCCLPQAEQMTDKLWYGSWMQADLVSRTSIVWIMTKKEFLEEEEEASMRKMLLNHGPGVGSCDEGPSGSKHGNEGFSRLAMCVVTDMETQTRPYQNLIWSLLCWGVMAAAMAHPSLECHSWTVTYLIKALLHLLK